MFGIIALSFLAGVVVTVVVAYFVARNNKGKAIELLNVDFKTELDKILANTDIDEKTVKFIKDIKNKF